MFKPLYAFQDYGFGLSLLKNSTDLIVLTTKNPRHIDPGCLCLKVENLQNFKTLAELENFIDSLSLNNYNKSYIVSDVFINNIKLKDEVFKIIADYFFNRRYPQNEIFPSLDYNYIQKNLVNNKKIYVDRNLINFYMAKYAECV